MTILYDDGELFVETDEFLGEMWYFVYCKEAIKYIGKSSSFASTNIVDVIGYIGVYYNYFKGNLRYMQSLS